MSRKHKKYKAKKIKNMDGIKGDIGKNIEINSEDLFKQIIEIREKFIRDYLEKLKKDLL